MGTTASLGGLPTVRTDVPIASVFLVLFLIGAVTHMAILQVNLRRKHKFILSGVTFGFCMARITTNAVRIAWASHVANVRLAIAASIFVSAGVVLLFVINIIFAQRILRATHPRLGWNSAVSRLFLAVYALVVVTLIMLIVVTVHSFYTLNPHTRHIHRNIQLYGGTCFAVVAFLPIPIVAYAFVRSRKMPVESFGSGTVRAKILTVLAAALLLTLGAAFRAGTNYLPLRPKSQPAWYHSRACFYIFTLGVEIIVVALFAIARIDLRFHVPNGASGPGDYSGANKVEDVSHQVGREHELADDESSPEKNARNDHDEESRPPRKL